MGLTKAISAEDSPWGVAAEYHKIGMNHTHYIKQLGGIDIWLYVDKDAADAGKDPLSIFQIPAGDKNQFDDDGVALMVKHSVIVDKTEAELEAIIIGKTLRYQSLTGELEVLVDMTGATPDE